MHVEPLKFVVMHNERTCLSCGKPLRGRADKKYCDDYCRTQYNNQQRAEDSTVINRVNQVLRKNRKILAGIVSSENDMGKCPKERLLKEGFQFDYHTHLYTNKKGNVYTFIYEYGLLPLEGDWYLVVRRDEERT